MPTIAGDFWRSLGFLLPGVPHAHAHEPVRLVLRDVPEQFIQGDRHPATRAVGGLVHALGHTAGVRYARH